MTPCPVLIPTTFVCVFKTIKAHQAFDLSRIDNMWLVVLIWHISVEGINSVELKDLLCLNIIYHLLKVLTLPELQLWTQHLDFKEEWHFELVATDLVITWDLQNLWSGLTRRKYRCPRGASYHWTEPRPYFSLWWSCFLLSATLFSNALLQLCFSHFSFCFLSPSLLFLPLFSPSSPPVTVMKWPVSGRLCR